MAFVWDVLHGICKRLGHAMVVLVRDVEHTVCSSFESYDAFVRAFGRLTKSGLPASGSQNNMVLIGGTSLSDKAPSRTPPTVK